MATYVTQEMLLIHREGLMKLINDGVEGAPSTWKLITPRVISSRQAYEQVQTHAGLGFFEPMDEVGGVTYDAAIPRYSKTYTPIVRTLGVKFSKQSRQKDLYGFIKAMGPMLAEAAVVTMNLMAANLINLGFGGGTTCPDGQAQFSAAHPLTTLSTYSNLGTSPLSGQALEDALQSVLAQVGDRGIPKYYPAGFKLVVGPLQSAIATRAVRSQGLQGTTDNDTNEFVSGLIKNVVVEQMIGFNQPSLIDAWALLPADEKNNPFFYIQVQGIETDVDKSIDFQEIKYVSDFEGTFDTWGWRGTFGSAV